MKKLIIILLVISICDSLQSQAPDLISYKSVIRDEIGNVVSNQPINLRLSILANSANGNVVFSETHSINTNTDGMISVNIGAGEIVYGQFDTISWSLHNHFLKTEIDISGETNYEWMGTSQFYSVPYALYAEDEDADSTNEIQSLQLVNNTISLSRNGGIVYRKSLFILGMIKMFAVSENGAVTISHLQSKGWAICDGTPPESQGISNSSITSTPDYRDRFIRMSNDTTSGTFGGSSTHNHSGYTDYNTPQSNDYYPYGTSNRSVTHRHTISSDNHIPPYYELLFFIKVK